MHGADFLASKRFRELLERSSISMKWLLACSKRSRTRDAPIPAKISTNSEAEMLKNGTPALVQATRECGLRGTTSYCKLLASPATALASRVFPVPGGPTNKAPFGILAPRSEYLTHARHLKTVHRGTLKCRSAHTNSLEVFFKKSTTSTNSCLAPSQPSPDGTSACARTTSKRMVVKGSCACYISELDFRVSVLHKDDRKDIHMPKLP